MRLGECIGYLASIRLANFRDGDNSPGTDIYNSLECESAKMGERLMPPDNYRGLTKQERELIVWLLEHGPSEVTNFLPQLDVISARSNCDCGCPSIEFSVPLEASYIGSPLGMRLHFTGIADGCDVGLMLVAGGGVLSELEVYVFGENKGLFGLPDIESLQPVA